MSVDRQVMAVAKEFCNLRIQKDPQPHVFPRDGPETLPYYKHITSCVHKSDPKGRNRLVALPSELLHLICSEICTPLRHGLEPGKTCKDSIMVESLELDNEVWKKRSATMSALGSTCRRLHDVCTPYLYETFYAYNPTTLVHFIRSLYENPRLATVLRYAVIRHGGSTYPGVDIRKTMLMIADHMGLQVWSLLRVCFKEPDLNMYDLWDTDTHARFESFLLDIFLHLAQNLSGLCLMVRDIRNLASYFMSPGIQLPELRTLAMVTQSETWFDGSQTMNVFTVAAPQMERLMLCGRISVSPSGLHSPLASLTHLTVRNSCLPPAELFFLVGASPKLESFVYNQAPFDNDDGLDRASAARWDAYVDSLHITPLQIAQFLGPVRHTLRNLVIRTTHWTGHGAYAGPDTDTTGQMVDLRGFDALQNLELDSWCVHSLDKMGTNAEGAEFIKDHLLSHLLPKEVVHVTIRGIGRNQRRAITHLAEQIHFQKQFPKLRTFEGLRLDPADWKAESDMFKKAGVQLLADREFELSTREEEAGEVRTSVRNGTQGSGGSGQAQETPVHQAEDPAHSHGVVAYHQVPDHSQETSSHNDGTSHVVIPTEEILVSDS